jgi:hypothetical protein
MLIPAELIREKVASLTGFFMGVHGMYPPKGFSGMSLLINGLRPGGMNRNPSTIFPASVISPVSPFR